MTTRRANLFVVLVFGSYIVFRTLSPAKEGDAVSDTIFNISIEFVGCVLLFWLLQFLQNINRLGFYFQTSLLLRKTDVRVSIAYAFTIKIENKYLLVKSNHRNYFQPVGGAFKTLPGAEKLFEKLKVRPDSIIETEKGIAKGDLRVHIVGADLIEFLEWFDSKEDRETSPWREFYEELIATNILPQQEFRHIDYRYKGTVKTPIFNLNSGGKGMFIYEIYDLVINREQQPILEDLLKKGDTDKYVWADQHLINRLGYDGKDKTHQYDISPHTKWVLNMKWE
jgi:hypothetical protein